MKLPAIAIAILAILATPLRADVVSPIHMKVDQSSKTKLPKAKAGQPSKPGQSTQAAKTQVRSLTIKLFNNSSETFDHLVVRYWFLGHDMKDHKITVLSQGERKSALTARGSDTVESESATSAYTEAHSEVKKGKGSKGSKGGKGGTTKVPASGKKIIGFAVQVLNGTQIVAEEYSEPSYKAIAQASAPSQHAPAPAKKTPAKSLSSKS